MYDVSMWLIDLSFTFFLSAITMIAIKAYTKKIKQAFIPSIIKVLAGSLFFALAKALENVPTSIKQQLNSNEAIKWLILLSIFALMTKILLAYRKMIVADKAKKGRKPHYSPRPQP